MQPLRLIIQFEFLQRIKKKSFWILTLLGPILYVALMAVPALLALSTIEKTDLFVYDESGVFEEALAVEKLRNITIHIIDDAQRFEQLKQAVPNETNQALLHIGPMPDLMTTPHVKIYSAKELGMQTIEQLERVLSEVLRRERAKALGLSPDQLRKLTPEVHIEHTVVTETGTKEAQVGLSYALAMVASVLIYISLSGYGGVVLNSVQEEKQNRLVEVLILAVRPFQLMLGKITGIGLVGLFQYFLWAVLVGLISIGGAMVLGSAVLDAGTPSMPMMQAEASPEMLSPEAERMMKVIGALLYETDWATILVAFLFYFVGGFFTYAAMFAAVGAAVDDPRDSQMFVLPLMLPILLSFIAVMTTINISPHSGGVFWMSMIPFTSPVAMMARIPFGVPLWEIGLSIALLLATAVLMVWVAGRVFRVGLLMYGTKPSWKTLWQWVIKA